MIYRAACTDAGEQEREAAGQKEELRNDGEKFKVEETWDEKAGALEADWPGWVLHFVWCITFHQGTKWGAAGPFGIGCRCGFDSSCCFGIYFLFVFCFWNESVNPKSVVQRLLQQRSNWPDPGSVLHRYQSSVTCWEQVSAARLFITSASSRSLMMKSCTNFTHHVDGIYGADAVDKHVRVNHSWFDCKEAQKHRL